MAKRRRPRKKARHKAARRPDWVVQLMKVTVSLALLILLVIAAALLAHRFLMRPAGTSVASVPPQVVRPVPKAPAPNRPTYEVFPKTALPPHPIQKPSIGDHPPKVAIIIDDMGYDQHMANLFLSLDAPLTLSMLPHGPFTRRIIDTAHAEGHEIMLHLPMEPNEYPQINPGPGALLADMSPDELIRQLESDLDAIPYVRGVNNHMGSKLSTSSHQMRQIFTILKKRQLYYIDSRTTKETVARPSARLLRLPFAERDIFIDHFDDPAFIRKQLKALLKRAQRQGYAIGIAHPHPNTYEGIRVFLPTLKSEVEMVPASQIVQPSG